MVKRCTLFLIWLSLALSATNLAPSFGLWHEINRNLGLYYFAAHLLTLLVLVLPTFEELRYRRVIFFVITLLSIFYAVHIYSFYVWPFDPVQEVCEEQEGCARITTLFAHLPTSQRGRAELASLIEAEAPAVVALVHGTPEFSDAHRSKYPYRIATKEGVMLWSKLELKGVGVRTLGDELPEVIMVDLVVSSERALQITVLDGEALTGDALHRNKLLTRRILTQLKVSAREGILFGSLHVTPFSSIYDMYLWAGGFANGADGFGLWHSWDGESFFKRFALDHLFIRGFIRVNHYEVRDLPGASRLPILAEIETPNAVGESWRLPEGE